MIARVYRVDEVGEGEAPRLSVELDGIDVEALDGDLTTLFLDRSDVGPFGLLRLELDPGEVKTVLGAAPVEGRWFSLTLFGEGGLRRAQAEHAQLAERGYVSGSRGYVGDVEFLADDKDHPLEPLSASVSPRRRRAQKAINGGVFPTGALMLVVWGRHFWWTAPPPRQVRVRDVGQAGFITLIGRGGRPMLHFDAGWPVSFNGHTAPPSSAVRKLDAPVLLSHWDWDHLHGYYVFPTLQTQEWLVPVQRLGPGASRVAAQLHARSCLFGLPGGGLTLGAGSWGRIATCGGPAGNKNQTGLAMDVDVAGRRGVIRDQVLMTGDADYQHAVAALGGATYSGLVITHHGAKFSGPVPPAHGGARAVVSYGENNTYRHPDPGMVSAHAGWSIERTAAHGFHRRGSRTLP